MGRKKKQGKPKNSIDENLYKEWIEFIFKDGAENSDLDEKYYRTSADDIVELIRLTCLRCGSDLKIYSNQQVNKGLNHLFDSASDNYVFSFEEADLYYTDIVIALQSIHHLYFDLFNERCDPILSHLDEKTDNPLNSICYMLWDVTPLAYWPDNPNSKHYYSAIATVMEKALNLSNPACIESGLHGLGHIHHEAKERVEQIIDSFLRKNGKKLHPDLIQYAKNAKIGYVQ